MTIALAALLVLALVAAVVAAVLAARRQQRLDAANDAIIALARAMGENGSSREHLVEAARSVAGAEVAFLAEPDRRAPALVVSAAKGASLEGAHLDLADPSATVRSYVEDTPVHVADLAGEETDAARTIVARTGACSGYVRPVRRSGHVVGVLALGWTRTVHQLAPERDRLVELLAAEAARAIERDARFALLARQARTDELTALPNRRAWDESVERELSRAQRTAQPLCLALLDLDHFKAYNDTLGHQAGDTHLRRTAAAWRRELRTIDVLARYGGEEFGILLPGTAVTEASEVIDRVRAATPHDQTASAGVVQWDGHESPDELLARADAALYRAKGAGRSLTLAA